MRVFDTSTMTEEVLSTLNADEASWIYNGLDCCVTAEVYTELSEQLKSEPTNVRETYEFALNKLAPILEMSMRGTKINLKSRDKTVSELERTLARLDGMFQDLMIAMTGAPMNWRSPKQLDDFFYSNLRLKEVKKRNTKGQYTRTTNAEALEYFSENYIFARPFCKFILTMRDLNKQLGFLRTELDEDNRIRTNYNITGTNTGRLASSMNDFGTGTNLQNVNRKLRFPFVADEGYYLLNVDLEQSDARFVGAICHQLFIDMPRDEIGHWLGYEPGEYTGPIGPEFASAFLDAAESGDLHTTVCRMTWPELAWPEDKAAWKKFCDGEIAHGQDSYRQLAKKLGHGTNFLGTPRTMAKHTHTSSRVISDFQNSYFGSFPCLRAWHNYRIHQLATEGQITTLFGRRRVFFDRGDDASTHRKGIAFEPQSCTGEAIDRGLHQVWTKLRYVELLNQVHDSILFQIPWNSKVPERVAEILQVMQVPLTLKGGRQFHVPLDAAGGWNWGYYNEEDNPHGIKGWKGEETRKPPEPSKSYKKHLTIRDYL